MNKEQRAAALRLADALDKSVLDVCAEAAGLLRALAAEPEPEVIATYNGDAGRREWVAINEWLHPGERIAILRDTPTPEVLKAPLSMNGKREPINMCLGCGDLPHPGFPCAEAKALREPVAEAVAWPEMPPSKGQSPVLFEDGYAEGWAKCLTLCKEAVTGALREPVAEPMNGYEPSMNRYEPVRWISWHHEAGDGVWDTYDEAMLNSAEDYEPQPLYLHPPQDTHEELERKSDAIQRLWKERDALREGLATARASLEKWRGIASAKHGDGRTVQQIEQEANTAFYKLTVAQRDAAWRDVEECDALRAKLADILTRTANALRGEPPPLTSWGWDDLPERAQQMREAADDVLTFAVDAVDGWESLAPLRVRAAASEALLRLKAAMEAK